MINQLILLIQVLGLFFYQLILTGDISVTQNVPETIVKGQESTVEILINKADAAGFAKVQQIIPEGFTVDPIDTKGATFSFKDNKVKFIWMSLPSEKEFKISYQLKPNANTTGDFTIGGKFSFIADSERKNIEIPSAKFTVVDEELIAEEEIPETDESLENESSDITEPEIEEIPEVVADLNQTLIDSTEEDATSISVNCKRTIEKIDNTKYKVSIEVDKKGVEGFAKISEILPQGFIASEIESKGGVFSFKKNEVKILWMGVPKEDVYVVNYSIEATEAVKNGDYEISGQYFYLDNDASTKSAIDQLSFNYASEQFFADQTTIDEVEENIEEEETTVAETENVEEEEEITLAETENIEEEEETTLAETENIEEEETTVAETENVEEELLAANEIEEEENSTIERLTSTPNPEHGVTYKIQIGAGHKKVSLTYFETKFNLTDNVSTINHEGWIKYLVGAFNEYKLARDKRDLVRRNVKTAFVTAYNSGTRITVQEALMITNQKWYK